MKSYVAPYELIVNERLGDELVQSVKEPYIAKLDRGLDRYSQNPYRFHRPADDTQLHHDYFGATIP